MRIVALDTETFIIEDGAIAPKLVCITFAEAGKPPIIFGNTAVEMTFAETMLRALLEDNDVLIVGHYLAFDWTVIAAAFPNLIPLIFEKLSQGLCTDTVIREKLLNLSTHGNLKYVELPDGSNSLIEYSLEALVLDYTGTDRSADKVGDDIWRMNYAQLNNVSAQNYPVEAIAYATQDASDTLEIYGHQAEHVQGEEGPGSVKTAEFHTAVDFALRLQTCWGMEIDQDEVARVTVETEMELTPEKLKLLIDAKILTPALPERPYKRGVKDANGLPKMKAATKAKISKKLLQCHVEKVCTTNQLEVKLTPKGQVSTDAEVLGTLAPLDKLIAQYQHRQTLQKLVTTYLPSLQGARTVHPNYDVLKATGRTSSFASNLYASLNVQQVDPRVRGCFVPRKGKIYAAADYSTIELASFAQMTYSLFGESVHRDKINAGINLHSYLGAQLAFSMDTAFRAKCAGMSTDEIYEAFMASKKSDPDFFRMWRNKMSKPTGLGLPGGMGVATFIDLAHGYGIEIDMETSEEMKAVWLDTYPEAKRYFDWIKSDSRDPHNSRINDRGQKEALYSYFSPMGMYRAACTYCAAANGNGLQTPTGEGAKRATFELARACYDVTAQSVLYGCRPVAMVHDELIAEIPDDGQRSERADAIGEIMVRYMQMVLPDVKIEVETSLMRRWDKRAEPAFDDAGKLIVWEPAS